MTDAQINALRDRVATAETGILNNAQLLVQLGELGRDLEHRNNRWARKLDELTESLAFTKQVICLLTARVEKVETQLKEIET